MIRGDVHDRWQFSRPSGEAHVVQVGGNRVSDDGDVVHRWALSGAGIAYKSWLEIAGDVGAGRLRVLCPAFTGEPAPLHLICPDRRLLGPAVQKLRAFLQTQCARLPSPP